MSGSVNAQFNLPPGIFKTRAGIQYHRFLSIERVEPPPNPSINIPSPREPDFVNRAKLLRQISERASLPGSRRALIGLEGDRASQSRKTSRQGNRNSPSNITIRFIPNHLLHGCFGFTQVTQPDLSKASVRLRILREFQVAMILEGDEKWLLVLDNADSDDVFQIVPKKANSQSRNDLADSSRKPLIEYVPRTPHGAVIITSRVREFALGMVNDRTLIEVKPMERKIG
ncbi:hypothetical protein VI817_002132 [Penicillium citrinum]|nr:hypothetical protein VI817_002132 [Penicillium citrinum]